MTPDSVDHPLRFLFIDFNSYFAAVEQHDDAKLANKPVIVIPIDSEHTGAIAVSYEAKALGIRRSTSVRDARAICPDVAIRPARHDRYVEMHNRLMAEIEQCLPIARIYSIDECACRLDVTESRLAVALAKATEIKTALSRNVGPLLRSSIGIAASPLLAKLAAELRKPDGLTVIEMHSLPDALAGLPLRAIPGVGEGVAKRLDRSGVTDFIGLWNLAPKQARAIWGSVLGERFIYSLRGHDVPDDAPRRKSMIGHSRVLSREHQPPSAARIVVRALLLKAASRLRLYRLYAGRMTLGIRLRPTGWLEFESQFTASQNSWGLLRELDLLWGRATMTLRRGQFAHCRIGLVSIALHQLDDTAPQPDLFVPFDSVEQVRERDGTGLWERIDNLNRRYKRQMVTLASHRGLDLNYLGVKIAFSRVPEATEFDC